MKSVKSSIGKITAPVDHISSNAIVAVITAMYLHEAEVEEQNRLHLTWSRSQLSLWRASNVFENRYNEKGRGNK